MRRISIAVAWLLHQQPFQLSPPKNIRECATGKKIMLNTLLIVDGCTEYREYLVDFFRKRDFEAKGCATYKEAQTLLAAAKFDVVVIDYFIIGSIDDDLAATIAAGWQNDTAIIIMSDQQTPAIERRIRQMGPAFYFVKPFAVDNLYAVVLKIFDFRDKKYLRKKKQGVAA